MRLRAHSVAKSLPARFAGRVHSVFRHAFNLELEGGGIVPVVAGRHAPVGGIQIPAPVPDFTALLQAGLPAACRGDVLRAGPLLAIALHGAELSAPAEPVFSWRRGATDSGQAWHCAWSRFQREPGHFASPALKRHLGHMLRAVQGTHGGLPAAVQALIGLGPGLTPSGDDALVGWLCAAHALRRAGPSLAPWCDRLADCIGSFSQRTTVISQHYLLHAAHGEVGVHLTGLVEAIGQGDLERTKAAMTDALSVGATSGADGVLGLLVGLASAHPNTPALLPGDWTVLSRRRLNAAFNPEPHAMPVAQRILHNLYRDSVALMRLAAELNAAPGVAQASAAMATEANLALLRESGLLEGAFVAGANDLLLVAKGNDEAALQAALDGAESALQRAAPGAASGGPAEMAPRSVEMALGRLPGANMALISTPGEYAAAEALKALRLGLHVMLFSDNVSEEAEISLKRFARSKGLLVMGPDCGTAILNGVPLGFANVVRRGAIGVVGASGTGTQQVTCLIDRLGAGVSQAIGTGGRDLHAGVEGQTMIQALEALAADPATRVIVVISKPPAAEVAKRVLEAAEKTGKPVVVNFLGLDPKQVRGRNLHPAHSLEDAAVLAVRLSAGESGGPGSQPLDQPYDAKQEALRIPLKLPPGQRAVRGLFSGGTFCYEALLLLGAALGDIYSNIPIDKRLALKDVWRSQAHTAIDLGDDRFTRGRPHPMIDHRLRNERIVQEAGDPETAVILLDVVLGHGSHPDPAAEMAPALAEARHVAAQAKRELAFVASVCGTAGDPQNLPRQEVALEAAGVHIAASNARAAQLAAALVQRGRT